MRLTLAIIVALFLSGCASQAKRARVCIDGWSRDHIGASRLYEPTEDERIFALSKLPEGYEVACWHLEGSGLKTVFVVSPTERAKFFTIRSSEDGIAVESEGIIVRANP